MPPKIYRTLEEIDQHNVFLSAPEHSMPKIRDLRLKAWNENQADGSALKPSDILSVPGGKILRKIGVADFEHLFPAFCDFFHGQDNWTWVGKTLTPSAPMILDGEAKTGQCLALASALRLLAMTRKPFGLGIPDVDLGRFTKSDGLYYGRYQQGFLSEHPIGGILNLLPNVYEPLNALPKPASRLAPLYLWENHKVLKYNGKFYDPSYLRRSVDLLNRVLVDEPSDYVLPRTS
jgi:hypothetical protein